METTTAHLRTSDQLLRSGDAAAVEQHTDAGGVRPRRPWRGHPDDPGWARPALLALLLATGLLYLWDLTSSGWGNSFYSAAAQAGSVNWEAFFFGSSDAANSITVDKPPASLWVMALSVRVFGLNSFAILMPQALMGVATVGVLYATVRRHFGAVAGLLAGVTLALTPVAALMFRFNNPDALLVLLMTLGAWATMRAIEHGSLRWAALVGVFLGFGFLTKTLQVFLVVPFFAIAFLLAANAPLRRRILGLLAAVGAMVVAGGWWVAVVQLVPASARPYIGGSQDNSFWNLTFGYNGFGRISGNETGSVGGGGGGGAGGQWGSTGLTRMFGSEVGGQVSWLMPTALVLLVLGLWLRGRAPRTDVRRAAYLVWGGWLLVTGLTFSLMAGIFHQYYTVALAPAIGALVGMGATEAWARRHTPVGSIGLALATAAAATWSFILLTRTTAYGDWLRTSILAIGMAAAFLLLALNWLHAKVIPLIVAAAIAAGLAGPTAYTITTVQQPHTGSIPTAGPNTIGGAGGAGAGRGMPAAAPGAGRSQTGAAAPGAGRSQTGAAAPGAAAGARPAGGMGGLLDASKPGTAVVSALQQDAGRYRWVAAAIGSNNAAGLQLATGLSVMPVGGFNGSDPSPTLTQFKSYVAQGAIHYFLAGSGMGGGQPNGSNTAQQIAAWVTANFKRVTIGGQTFYDLTQPTSSTSGATS
ncbi:ArnT family glycosyltransferase [Flexivirga meconopsidis]|uniref:ArnT family glycosyltransferase n=1 Tax=Flexivirga meconopsidis TaxID=2977121 RepID=UPI00223EB477|nr:glycosyltransferase family 39 protein [Flexivirga meconopsidis]